MFDPAPHELPGNIFMQPWWLDIVAPGRWNDIQIKKGGQIYARWPIVSRKEKGLVFIEMPVLTQKLGPWIKIDSDKKERIHSIERTILEELIENIPEFDKFVYNLNISVDNYLPFVWKGFEQRSRTTFQIKNPINTDKSWKELKSSVRRHIKKAKELLTIDHETSAQDLYDIISKTFNRQGLKVPYSFETLKGLYSEGQKKGRAQIISARDSQNQLHAAQLLIHDDEVTYYLAGGINSDFQVAGAASLLLWNSINEAKIRGNTFDFEGSSIKSIERYFTSFGAQRVHFHQIYGMSRKYSLIKIGKDMINLIKG